MVLTKEETIELEVLKNGYKKELMELQNKNAEADHNRKMEQLKKLHEIALAGGIGYIEK